MNTRRPGIAGRNGAIGSLHPCAADAASLSTNRVVLMLGTSPEVRGGVAAVVAALRGSGLFERARVRYVATHVDGPSGRKVVQFLGAAAKAIRVLVSDDVAIVHAHIASNGSFWRKAMFLWIARRFGVATIFHLHGGDFNAYASHGFGGPVLRWCIRQTLESSSVVVVLSERWAAWARKFAPRSRVGIIGNPVRCLPLVDRSNQRDQSGAGGGRVLFLGMICDAKGSFDLLRAWAQFCTRVPGWRLVIGGNGEVERFLVEAKSLGIRDDVDYIGWVTGADKERELSAADIFVLPSYNEGMPVSILEAMAHGAAVITTPVGGVHDMMQPNRDGLWVEPGDVQGLARCLERLARCPDLRARLGAASNRHVLANFAVETVVARILETYLEVRERHHR